MFAKNKMNPNSKVTIAIMNLKKNAATIVVTKQLIPIKAVSQKIVI